MLFQREDESDDENFYQSPRFSTHIDDATIDMLTQFYRETLSPGADILDLMSSWISHLPPEVHYGSVTGLGMNLEELKANPRLDSCLVQNLNRSQNLPFPDQQFDAVMIVVSVQYLTSPFTVFKEIGRVLKSNGICIVAMSHRLFPTKAIRAFQVLSSSDRGRLVATYMEQSDQFVDIELIDRSPINADPLWIVQAQSR